MRMIAPELKEPGATGANSFLSGLRVESPKRRAQNYAMARPSDQAIPDRCRRRARALRGRHRGRCRWPCHAATESGRWQRGDPRDCLVGDCTSTALPPNATRPMRTSGGRSSTKAFAAACAAVSPIGVDIGSAHAERYVDREDDRLLQGGQGDASGRTRHRDNGRDHRQQEQEGRDMLPDLAARGHRLPYQDQAWIPEGCVLSSPQQEHVRADECRYGQQQPEHFGPDESQCRLSCR